MNKKEVLEADLIRREKEIFGYQINIDNYRRAIARIEAEYAGDDFIDREMRSFAERLTKSLQSEQVEQRKSMVLRDVVAEQLAELSDG